MKRIAFIASLLALLLGCTACLATGGASDDSPPSGNNRPSEGSSDQAADDSPQGAELAFGKSYTWDDGVTITVSKPAKFRPSEYSEVKGAKAYRKFTITVVNKSSGPIDLNLAYITMQSNNKEAEQVFDSENGLEGSPSTKLLRGRESEWEIGFGVANPKDMVMEVSLQDDFARPSIIYST